MRRAKRYPADELGALVWLRQMRYWLQSDIDGCWHPHHTLTPYELLGLIEAVALIDFAIAAIKADLHNEMKARLLSRSEAEQR